MGGDSSPAARARTSPCSDNASGHRDSQKKTRDLLCPGTSGHLHQTSGGVRLCQMHLGFLLHLPHFHSELIQSTDQLVNFCDRESQDH